MGILEAIVIPRIQVTDKQSKNSPMSTKFHSLPTLISNTKSSEPKMSLNYKIIHHKKSVSTCASISI